MIADDIYEKLMTSGRSNLDVHQYVINKAMTDSWRNESLAMTSQATECICPLIHMHTYPYQSTPAAFQNTSIWSR